LGNMFLTDVYIVWRLCLISNVLFVRGSFC
jgi:hypothetical protein